MPLTFAIDKQTSPFTVSLTGAIDEHCAEQLTACKAALESSDVILDCAGISSINSLGVVHWLSFISDITKASKPVYKNVPEILLDTGSMINDFWGEGHIRSFFVSQRCEKCDATILQLFEATSFCKLTEAPTITCNSCGADNVYNDDIDEIQDSLREQNKH